MNIKSIPEKKDTTTFKVSVILLWVMIVAIPYVALVAVIKNQESNSNNQLSYATSESQQAIDSQLKGSPMLNVLGGCNCPYCCKALSLNIYK